MKKDPNNLPSPASNGQFFNLSGDGLFFSFQGEGATIGFPTVFLRLQVCNLNCSWCDTPYTWNMDHESYWEWNEAAITDIAQQISALWNEKCKNPCTPKRLVITGGEPLLQREAIDTLMQLLPNWHVELETNGTIMPTSKQLAECQFNCSPKLAHSDNHREDRIVPEVLKAIRDANSQFKFVAQSSNDLEEIQTDFVLPFGIAPEQVVIMPEGDEASKLRARYQELVQEVLAAGFRILPRLHVEVFNSRRRT